MLTALTKKKLNNHHCLTRKDLFVLLCIHYATTPFKIARVSSYLREKELVSSLIYFLDAERGTAKLFHLPYIHYFCGMVKLKGLFL